MRLGNIRGSSARRIRYAFCISLSAGLLTIGSTIIAQDHFVPESDPSLVCSICHSCNFPTVEDLCLKKSFCLRFEAQPGQVGSLGRSVMVLDELESVYDPVYFSHGVHAQMSEMKGGCENCHHFVPPSAGHPSCKECHTPEGRRNGKVQPGLKAAYHRQCMGCHTEWDTEAHCEVCHVKKEGGMSPTQIARVRDKRHQGHTLKMIELIVFETDYDDGDKVPFHHLNHVEKYDRDCSVCHKNEGCANCHIHGSESHPLGLIGDIDLHDTCYQCHNEDDGCEQCHGRNPNDLFDHATTGWKLKPFHKVLACTSCHKVRGKYTANNPRCETCHADGWKVDRFNHGITGVVLDDVHVEFDCDECHTGGIGTPAVCSECHDDGRRYTPHASFGIGADAGN